MTITIKTPMELTVVAGQTITLYKNTKGLYVAILNGIEVGLAAEVQSDVEIAELPSCMEGTVEADTTGTSFTVLV